jgi:hypothetical protein
MGVARMMSEDETSRRYFLGSLPNVLDEQECGDEGSEVAVVGVDRQMAIKQSSILEMVD